MLQATSPSTTAPNAPRGASCPTTPQRSRLAPTWRKRGTRSTRHPRRHEPAPLRDRHHRRCPRSPVDVLHRGPFHVPEGRLRRRGHDAVHHRAPRRSGARPQDRAVYQFAAKVAADAASVDADDVERLRTAGLTDAEIADVVFAASARCFFTAVLDGLGAQLDIQTAETFPEDLLSSMVVGRPVAER